MNPTPPPSDHEELKALLAESFHSKADDDTPPLPDDLRQRIRDQYGQDRAVPDKPPRESLLEQLLGLLRRPAFAGTAAAVILLAVAVVVFLPRDSPSGMRGTGPADGPGLTIVLYQVDGGVKEALLEKGFDEQSIRTATSASDAAAGEGRTIVLDGAEGEIELYPSRGTAPTIWKLPATPASIATEVLKLAAPPRQE